jgi:hypothetical protein
MVMDNRGGSVQNDSFGVFLAGFCCFLVGFLSVENAYACKKKLFCYHAACN